ncbi:MAG: oligosaccharide flippase family protein [Chitinophagaceae bacterium]
MFKSVGITFATKLLVAIINFAMIILLSRVLGPDGKGICSLYLVIFSTSLILCECISGSTVVYLLSKFSYRQLLYIFYAWSIPCSLLIGAIFYGLLKIDGQELVWILILNWLNAAVSMHQLVALGKEKLPLFNLLNILQAVLSITAVFFCFNYFAASPVNYLIALSIAWGLTYLIGLVTIFKIPETNEKVPWKELVKAGFTTGIANQAGTLMQLVNTRIGYMLLSGAELGIYSNAVSLCEATLLINSSIGTVQYSRIVNEKKRPEQIKLTHQCFWTSAWLMITALVVLTLLPQTVYTFVFGSDFNAVQQPIRLLAPGMLFYSGYIIFSYFFSGTGRFAVNNFPALAGLSITLLGYAAAKITGIPITMPLVAVMLVLSYTTLFAMSLILFLQVENITLKEWVKMPSRQSLKELF